MKINEILSEAANSAQQAAIAIAKKKQKTVSEVAGAQKCWPGHRKVGTQPGTGKNAGKRVNDCEKIKEDEIDEAAQKGLYYNVNKRKAAGTSRSANSPKAPTAQAWKDAAKTAKKEDVSEGERTMSRAAKGHEKYGKEGMQALAKAGRDGASEEKLDKIRDRHNKYDESIEENFADGRNPQDKGDSKRHGVPTKSSVSNLRKVAKQGGRKGQLAHWMANMKAGRAKNEGEGDPEGLPHLTREMLGNIVQQVETEGARAIVKSLEWGDGAAVELLDLIVSDLKKHLESNDLSLDEQFDIIEEMVEQLAEEHGVDAEVIWEDFESVDDDELFESAAWKRKEGKSKKGGLNAKGVASYRRENPGSKLQTAVTTKPSKLKKGSKAAKRRKSFCARMGGVKGPMKKPNGKPTRKALALRKWNC